MLSDLCGENRPKAVPPEPNGFVADVDTALEEKIFNLPERQRVPHVHHHGEADDLRRTVALSEWISHPSKLRTARLRLKPD